MRRRSGTRVLAVVATLGLAAASAQADAGDARAAEHEALALETLGGDPVHVSLSPGDQALLVHFWATWCHECVDELPLLADAARACARAGVRIVAVDVGEDSATVEAFLAAHAIDARLPILRDPKGRVWRRLSGVGLPVNLTWTDTGRKVSVGAREAPDWRATFDALGCSARTAGPRPEHAPGSPAKRGAPPPDARHATGDTGPSGGVARASDPALLRKPD